MSSPVPPFNVWRGSGRHQTWQVPSWRAGRESLPSPKGGAERGLFLTRSTSRRCWTWPMLWVSAICSPCRMPRTKRGKGCPLDVDIDLETRAIVIFLATASNLLQAASYGKRVALAETSDRLSGTPSISNSLTPSSTVRPGSEVLSPRNTPANRRFSRSGAQSGLSPYAHVALVSFGSH